MFVAKEITKNLIKGLFPTLVDRLRGNTGRSREVTTPQETQEYCSYAFHGHLAEAGVTDLEAFLHKAVVVEFGPGDTLAAGLLYLGHGASQYIAVDRFSYQLDSKRHRTVYELVLDSMGPDHRKNAERAFRPGRIGVELDPQRLSVVSQSAENVALENVADVVVSQSVLEHVYDLSRVFQRIATICRPSATIMHQVDLSDHGLFPEEPLRFLNYAPALWTAMNCYRGSPNRERLPRYRQLLMENGFHCKTLIVQERLPEQLVQEARPSMHSVFREVSDEDLQVLGFRFMAQRAASSSAS